MFVIKLIRLSTWKLVRLACWLPLSEWNTNVAATDPPRCWALWTDRRVTLSGLKLITDAVLASFRYWPRPRAPGPAGCPGGWGFHSQGCSVHSSPRRPWGRLLSAAAGCHPADRREEAMSTLSFIYNPTSKFLHQQNKALRFLFISAEK